MTAYLFRANSNDNGVYLSYIFDEDGKPIGVKKSSATFGSIKRLKREVNGAEWYSKLSFIKLASIIKEFPSYYYEYEPAKVEETSFKFCLSREEFQSMLRANHGSHSHYEGKVANS